MPAILVATETPGDKIANMEHVPVTTLVLHICDVI